jgi:phosphatidylglycerophosphate synthase
MIGKLLREPAKRVLASIGKAIAKTRIKPNTITLFSLVVAAIAAYFIYSIHYGWAFVFILLAGVMDSFDGSVARATGQVSKWGNYIDAIVDRYVEMLILLGFAFAGYPIPALIALTGGVMISYAKARTALVVQIKNDDWPSLGDRTDKFIIILSGLLVSFFAKTIFGIDTILVMLCVLAAVNHIGAIQRLFYARKLIK